MPEKVNVNLEDLMRLYLPAECTGKDGYPPAWHETLKHAVREQAGHRCIRCFHPYRKGDGEWCGSPLPHPHRPPSRRQQGQLPLVESRRALPAMPPEIQGKVKMERRWLHEHSDWFKPYVAGYYAHV
jgi:hypothetical protein